MTGRSVELNYAKNRNIIDIFIISFIFALAIRLAACIGYYNINDTFWYRDWAIGLQSGIFDIYKRADSISLDYPPIYLFFLYITGLFYKVAGIESHEYIQMLLMKMWPILADMVLSLVLFSVIGKEDKKAGLVASLLWMFNPAAIFNSSFWGQTDQLMCLLLFLSFWLLEKDHPLFASALFAVAGMTKFQSLFCVPLFLAELFMRYGFKKFMKGIGVAAASVAAVFIPFMIGSNDPLLFLHVYLKGQGSYPYYTLNAYNLYGMFGLNGVRDTSENGGLVSPYVLSIVMLAIFVVAIIVFHYFSKNRSVFVTGYLLLNTIFMFTTRMHERYQFAALIFLLAAAVVLNYRPFYYCFAALSFIVFVNHMIPMFMWNSRDSFFEHHQTFYMVVFSALNLILYFVSAYYCLKFSTLKADGRKALQDKGR